MSEEAMRALTAAPWQGNVRELQHYIERCGRHHHPFRVDLYGSGVIKFHPEPLPICVRSGGRRPGRPNAPEFFRRCSRPPGIE